jgi:hypothetical protein
MGTAAHDVAGVEALAQAWIEILVEILRVASVKPLIESLIKSLGLSVAGAGQNEKHGNQESEYPSHFIPREKSALERK